MQPRRRVLVDNCVPKRFLQLLDGIEAMHVLELGWGNLTDGELLDRMADTFCALLTLDRSLPFQQKLADRSFGVIILRARSSRLDDLRPLAAAVIEAAASIALGQVQTVQQ